MTLDGRDRAVVQLVARFNQLTSAHIQSLIFHDRSSHTPCHRALKRLAERGVLARIERRTAGGSRGGSGQYVYQLGPKGHALYRQGRYIPARTVNYHSLAIADTYITLLFLSNSGALDLIGYSNEPDCWTTIGRHELKPDLYVEIERRAQAGQLKLWFEIDMGTEGQRQIRGKLERYWDAYNIAGDEDWPVFPVVVWLAVDEYRARELRWIIEQVPKDARPLFRVMTPAELSTAFA